MNGLVVVPGKNAAQVEYRSACSNEGVNLPSFLMIDDGSLNYGAQNLILLPLSVKAKVKDYEEWECTCDINCQHAYIASDDVLLFDLEESTVPKKPSYIKFTHNYSTSTFDLEELVSLGAVRFRNVIPTKLLKEITELRRHDGRCLEGFERHAQFEFQKVVVPTKICCGSF